MGLVSRCVWLMVVVSFMSVNNLQCSAVQDFQLDHVNTKYVCQNDSISLRCPSASLLEIQAASFGRAMSVICASGVNADRSCDILDKKLIVKQLCDYKSECTFAANAENFGNDCPDVDKYLNIIYACVRNPDMEYFKTKATTVESPSTPSTQPIPFNATTFPSNVTQAPNITMSNSTTTIQPRTAPNKSRKKSKVPIKKIRYFNPDGPELDFLAKGGQTSMLQVKEHTHVIILIGLGTLTLLQWLS